MPPNERGAAMAANHRTTRTRLATIVALVAVLALFGTAAVAEPTSDVIVLEGATSAEGIARGYGSSFFAGDLFAGDIFRGDIQGGRPDSSSKFPKDVKRSG